MSGKGKVVECCGVDGESGRKHRGRPRREEVTEKGKEVQCCGGDLEYSGQVPPPREAEEYYWEDGVAYLVVGGNHEMTRRELIEYTNKVAESEEESYVSVPNNDYYQGLLDFMANLALGKYNEEQGTQLEFYAFQKANRGCSTGGLKYYITFAVVDRVDYANPIKLFQAQVVELYKEGQYRVDQIRPKPTAA